MSEITTELSELLRKLIKVAPKMLIMDRFLAQAGATPESEERRINFMNMLNSVDGGRSQVRLMPYFLSQNERLREPIAAAWLTLWLQTARLTVPSTVLTPTGAQLIQKYTSSNQPNNIYSEWMTMELDSQNNLVYLQFQNTVQMLQVGMWARPGEYSWDPQASVIQGGIPLDTPFTSTAAYRMAFAFADEYLYAITRRVYVDMYVELNPYYAQLYDAMKTGNFETDIAIRYNILNAEDFELLYIPDGVFTDIERRVFETTYSQCREYFIRTRYNPVYADNSGENPRIESPEDYTYRRMAYYRAFCKMMLISDVIQKYTVLQIGNTKYVPDLMTSVDLNHKLAMYRLYSELKEIPDSIKRTVLNNIQRMFQLKGTDTVLQFILSLFAFTDVYVSRYDLVKITDVEGMTDGILKFLRLPLGNRHIEDASSKNSRLKWTQFIEYDEFVSKDPYWKAVKQQILAMPFGSTPTKYISIEIRNRITQDVFQTQTLLSYMLSEYSTIDWSSANYTASISEIDNGVHRVPDLLIAAMYGIGVKWGVDTSALLETSASDRFFQSRYDRIRNIHALVGLTGQQLLDELETQRLSYEAWHYALKPVLMETYYRTVNRGVVEKDSWRAPVSDASLQQMLEKTSDGVWNVPFISFAANVSTIPPQALDYLARTTNHFNAVLSEWTAQPENNWRGHREYIEFANTNDYQRALRYISSWRYKQDMRDIREHLLKSQIAVELNVDDTWDTWRSVPADERLDINTTTGDRSARYYKPLFTTVSGYALTLKEYLSSKDYGVLRYIDGVSNVDELNRRIVVILDALESILQSTLQPWNNIENPINQSTVGPLNPRLQFLLRVLKVLILRFKSYTVTLRDMGFILIIDDPDYCSIRPVDEILEASTDVRGDVVELVDKPREYCRCSNLLMRTFPLWWDFTYTEYWRNVGTLGSYYNLRTPSEGSDWELIEPVFTGKYNYLQFVDDTANSFNIVRPYCVNGWQWLQSAETNADVVTVGMWVEPDYSDVDLDHRIRPVLSSSPGKITAPFVDSGATVIYVNDVEYRNPDDEYQPGRVDPRLPDDEQTSPSWYLVIVSFYKLSNPRVWINGVEYVRDDSATDDYGWAVSFGGTSFHLGAVRNSHDDNAAYPGKLTNLFAVARELSVWERSKLHDGGPRMIYERCLPKYISPGSIELDNDSLDFGEVVYVPDDL
jgi:hypothetical protein